MVERFKTKTNMPIQPIIAPRGGLRFDLPADLISDVEMSGGQNVFFEDGVIKKRYGYTRMGNTSLPLSGAVVGIDQFYDFSGNNWLFALTENKIYHWNTSTDEWETHDSTNYGEGSYGEGLYGQGDTDSFSGTDEDFFSYDYIRKTTESDPWWVCTNGVDSIKVFKGSGYTNVEPLIADYPSGVTALLAKYVVEFKDHLLLLDVSEEGNRYPQRIRWSDTADPEDFLNGNASYVDLPGADWIVGGIKFRGDFLAVFKEKSIWLGTATGETDIFDFDQIIAGTGCASGQTIRNLPNEIIFLGWDNVYSFNGIDVTPIGLPIQRELVATLNPEEINRCFAKVVEDQNEYWLFIPTGSNTYPDVAWCYNYRLRKWTKYKYSNYITMFGDYQLQATVSFNNLVGSFNGQTWRYDDRTLLLAMPITLLGNSDGYVYKYTTARRNEYWASTYGSGLYGDGFYSAGVKAVDAYFDTKDFNFTQLMERQRIPRMDISWKGTGLDIYYSTDKGDTWTLIKSLGDRTTFNRQKLSFRNSADWHRFRFQNDALDGWFHFSRANIHWLRGGRI